MSLTDRNAEAVVLGTLLRNPDLFAEVSLQIRSEDFTAEAHRIIYDAIARQHDAGSRPDETLVIQTLSQNGQLDKAGGRSYIMEIILQSSPHSINVFSGRVKELSLKRRLLEGFRALESTVESQPLDSLLSETEAAMFRISERYSAYTVAHISDVRSEFREFLDRIQKSDGGITGQATGFSRFDSLTGGLKGGQMIVLAARPGVGKTTLALNMVRHMSLQKKAAVLIFSLEMTRLELFLRLVCAEGHVDSMKVSRGHINKQEMTSLTAATAAVYSSDIYIDDSGGLNSWEFKQRSRRLANQLRSQSKKLDLIVVDYLQLMTDTGKGSESRQVEVASISRSIKLIAKELDVPVIAISQMNRAIEQRGKDSRPQLSDLRESGAIEQDADMVVFLHREELYNHDLPEDKKGVAEIIIAKHRAGPTDRIEIGFLKEKNLFLDLDPTVSP